MTPCDECNKPISGFYDFKNLCCRVRFLLQLPDKDIVKSWLARWRSQPDMDVDLTKSTYIKLKGNQNHGQ